MIAALRADAQQIILLPDNEPEQLWLVSRNGSWACQTSSGDGDPVVTQGGPTRIWDDVESAFTTWDALGRPDRHTFGLTITATGEHIIWHGEPSCQLWSL